jgi:hypothetical protein
MDALDIADKENKSRRFNGDLRCIGDILLAPLKAGEGISISFVRKKKMQPGTGR